MTHSLNEIKLAAYNHQELPNMKPNEAALWQGLSYCYDWFRYYPEDETEECKRLAEHYIKVFWNDQQLKEI